MALWVYLGAFSIVGILCLRMGYRRWRQKRIAARRRIELPNSHYASKLVRHQIDRERWGELNVSRLHPVNREEVERLLGMVDALGPDALSPRERLFLDHLTNLRFG